MTYGKEELRQSIRSDDSEAIVDLVESAMRSDSATLSERLLCGVTLLLPPLADYVSAKKIFVDLLATERWFEAAIWDCYRHAHLLPDGDCPFEQPLISTINSPVALHMLALHYNLGDDMMYSRDLNKESYRLRSFPFNLVYALRNETSLETADREEFWLTICDLIISSSAEDDRPVETVDGKLQRRWENLILGTRVTSPLWDHYTKILRPR